MAPSGNQTQLERHRLVGKGILAGLSTAEAMRQAGYAHATSTNPTASGVVPRRCVELALQGDKGAATATIRAKALDLFDQALEKVDPAKINLLTAAKTAEVACRLDLGTDPASKSMNPRDFGERVAWMQAAMDAYRKAKARPDGTQSVLSLQEDTLQATEDTGDTCDKVT